ncbi:twin-arginine translocase TatA/TatE family subunit [Chloroflexota bacterium]
MRPPGPLEIGLILVIILIVFGVGKLPQVGAAFGKGIRAFKRGQTEDEEVTEDKPKKKTRKKKKVAKKATAESSETEVAEKPAAEAEEKSA